jgi:mannitol-specific phosphotransferase system IIBC component
MKRTDLAMIILIAAVSAGIAYFVAHSLFGGITEQGVKVKTIDPITSVIQAPDKNIFNSNAINPAIEVNISNSSSTTGATNP